MAVTALLLNTDMIDNDLTMKMKAWLDNDSHTDRDDIMEGALMLLKLNRNRALFNTISRRPERYVSKIVYELGKFLPMRLNLMTLADVKRLDAELTPEIESAVTEESEDNNEKSPESMDLPAHGGKRSDHDSLPENIKSIWVENADRWKRIKQIFNKLKTLSQPCDRYELLMQLKEAWYKYKAEFERYDSFELSADNVGGETSPVDLAKQISNARSYISKNVDKLLQLKEKVLSDNPTDKDIERYKSLCNNLNERLALLLDNSQVVGEDVLAKLADGGVEINNSGNGEENESKSDTETSGD